MFIDEITTKNFKKESGIYSIRNLINNKCYIGQAKKVYNRLINHKSELLNNKHENTHLQRSFNKNGSNNFDFKVLEYCDIKNLTEREKYFISIEKECYNIRDACDSVIHPKRKPITEETRNKLKLMHKGKIPKNLADLQENRKKKIICYKDNKFFKIFESCKETAKYFNIDTRVLNSYLKKRMKKSKYIPNNYKLDYYDIYI